MFYSSVRTQPQSLQDTNRWPVRHIFLVVLFCYITFYISYNTMLSLRTKVVSVDFEGFLYNEMRLYTITFANCYLTHPNIWKPIADTSFVLSPSPACCKWSSRVRHVVRYTRPCNQCSDRNKVDNRVATSCSLRGVDKTLLHWLSSEERICSSETT